VAYERRIDRANPGCIFFLVDQSGSMTEPVHGTATPKMTAVAEQINDLLTEFVLACSAGDEGVRHYFDIGLVGYGKEVGPALRGNLANNDIVSIVELANNPLATTPGPVWLQPVADGATPMCGAIDKAGRLMAEWANHHPESFPPIVINISDGAATDGEPTDLADLAGQLRSLKTLDGELLFFNVNISSRPGSPVLFPSGAAELPVNDELAAMLFEISSRLTPDQLKEAKQLYAASDGARGFAFNTNISALRQFLRIGTMVRNVDDRPTTS
jgi:hypothetical protein